jgi:hypothetical protein
MSVQLAHESHWRDDGTCSYCGSISPADLFAAIEAGCELGPTDKDYKVYVTRPDPRAGEPEICGSANFRQDPERGWVLVTPDNVASLPTTRMRAEIGHWVQVRPTPANRSDKFYFQHLSADERRRFVELLNARALNIGYPGHFYRLPFFCRVQP